MSFSNAPDRTLLGRVAGALGVDEAFVEKDWFVVAAIDTLVGLGGELFIPVFSGGTSLLKAHGLIKRFSEDIDFKLLLSDAFLELSQGQRKKALSALKYELAERWAALGFRDFQVEAGSGNAFIKIEMDYPTVLDGHDSLRPHILAEVSAKSPRRPPLKRSVSSFVAQFEDRAPEVPAILCVDPVETAADKLSALAWRVLVRERGGAKDDPTIIRHVHDLAALESAAAADQTFGALLEETLKADRHRGGDAVAHLALGERLEAMLAKLTHDPLYEREYDQFVGGMAFAEAGDLPDFATSTSALRRLAETLPHTS